MHKELIDKGHHTIVTMALVIDAFPLSAYRLRALNVIVSALQQLWCSGVQL